MTTYDIAFKRSNPNALSARLATKLLAIIFALTLVMGLLVCGIDKAFAGPMPKTDVLVKGEKIRLGDVFDGLQQNADFVLAPAPSPGEELVWNTPTLQRIATAFDLPWRPADGDAVRIRRDASLVDSATLKAVVRDHLAGAGDLADTYNVAFTSDVPQIIVPGDNTPRIDLTDFNMQPVGGTFSAVVKVSPAEGGTPQVINLRGVAERMVRVPVLKADLRNGQIIGASDITWVMRKAATLRPDAVRDENVLLGATPRRAIAAGELIRDDSFEMPRMVTRGDLVTMVFNQHGMFLTTRGRALEDGAMGQTIKVSNTGSNRTIEARVTNAKEVTVN